MKNIKGVQPKGITVLDEAPQTQVVPAATVETSPTGDVSGPLDLALSEGMRDELIRQLREDVARVREGFDVLGKTRDIHNQGRVFDIVEAFTIDNYVDRSTGEESVKYLFKLQFQEGDVAMIMQSHNGPRAQLAGLFARVRALGGRLKAGPYKLAERDVGRIQPALIFEQQPGFDVVATG